jgi:hypothetical protein
MVNSLRRVSEKSSALEIRNRVIAVFSQGFSRS